MILYFSLVMFLYVATGVGVGVDFFFKLLYSGNSKKNKNFKKYGIST